MKILLISIIGFLSGFLGGQVGGGGLILLPFLLFLGLSPITAVATSRFAFLFGNFTATIPYLKEKKIQLKPLYFLFIIAFIGAMLGAHLTQSLSESVLKQIIAITLIFGIVVNIFKKDLGLVDGYFSFSKRNFFLLGIFLFLIGIYGGVVGIAMASFLSILFLFFGQSFSQAMGYSFVFAFIMSISSTLFFIYQGNILYYIAFPLALSVALGAWIGAKYALFKGNLWIKNLFITMVLASVIKLLFDVYF